MEGLIPLVYRKVRRKKTRRQYECLSSGTAQSFNVEDFYINDESPVYMRPSTEKIGGLHAERNGGHRRHKSVGNYSGSAEDMVKGASPPRPKQMVRFRSHRMLSCITGA
ncbi:hypothetical protein L1049_016026 [Liquidambar formosana]|uniref:Uncharacterized protein n=1 Tax=Liquidambar formosana TaxID=63359 RepID=A0AAP0X2W0_LIQFO